MLISEIEQLKPRTAASPAGGLDQEQLIKFSSFQKLKNIIPQVRVSPKPLMQ